MTGRAGVAWGMSGRGIGSLGALCARVLCLVAALAVLALAEAPARAQVPGFDRLLGGQSTLEDAAAAGAEDEGGSDAARGQSRRSSTVPPRFRAAEPATAEDYSRLLSSPAATGLAEPASPFGLKRLEDYVDVFRARLAAIVYRAPSAFGELSTTMQAASPTGRPVHFLGIAAFAGLLLIAGRAVTELFNVYVARPIFVRMQRPDPVGYGEKLPVLAARLALSFVGVAICLAVAAMAGVAFHDGHQPTLVTVLAVFAGYAAIILAHTFWRMVLAPFLPDYRLPAIRDRAARGLYRWLSFASIAAILAAVFSHWTAALGLPREVLVVVTAGSTLAALALLITALRVNRETITAILLGGGRGSGGAGAAAARIAARASAAGAETMRREHTWLQQVVSLGWEPLAYLGLAVTWAELAFSLVMGVEAGAERIMAPFMVLVAAMLVYASVVYLSDRVFARQRRIREMNAAARAAEVAEHGTTAERAPGAAPDAAPTAASDTAPDAAPDTASDTGAVARLGSDPGGPAAAAPRAADPDASATGDGAAERAAADRERRLARTDGPTIGMGDGEGGEDEGSSGGPAATRAAAPRQATGGMRSFEDLARRVASLLALGTAAWIILWFWGGREIFAESAFFGIAEDVVDIVFIGYVVFHAARIWLDRKIAEEGADEDPSATMLEGEGGGAGATRLATLLPLLRNFILGVIGVTVALLIAIEMGVNVAPLFAGAGIVGLAIGFGAQTLVRDIISGAFFLIDDAFRKGEYIDVGSVKGTVEKISLRSFQLRHHLGMLHTIPFGEIQYLTNFSRDWVMMKLPLRLTYDTDVEKVRKLIKKLGQRLMEDETVGHLFLQPLKSQGVIQMEDSAMIVRVKFMTRPGDQWVTRKRVFAEIRELFEREGIKFAHREVTVRIPEMEGREDALGPVERQALGAATRANLDVIEAEATRRTGTGGPADDR